jgi:hypothetical protein
MGQSGRRAGPARKKGLSVVPGPQGRHDGPARHGTKRPSGLIGSGRVGPGFFGLVPGSGRAAHLEFYSSRRLRLWLGHQVEASPGMGRGMAGVRRTGRRRACGRRPMTTHGRRGVAGVQAARGTVRGTHTHRVQGLGRSVRPNGRRPASAFVYGVLAACRRG